MCAYDCAQHTTQNSFDNLPSYLQTTIIAQMLSIGGEWGQRCWPLSIVFASTEGQRWSS